MWRPSPLSLAVIGGHWWCSASPKPAPPECDSHWQCPVHSSPPSQSSIAQRLRSRCIIHAFHPVSLPLSTCVSASSSIIIVTLSKRCFRYPRHSSFCPSHHPFRHIINSIRSADEGRSTTYADDRLLLYQYRRWLAKPPTSACVPLSRETLVMELSR
jgi:hypothetical protein